MAKIFVGGLPGEGQPQIRPECFRRSVEYVILQSACGHVNTDALQIILAVPRPHLLRLVVAIGSGQTQVVAEEPVMRHKCTRQEFIRAIVPIVLIMEAQLHHDV